MKTKICLRAAFGLVGKAFGNKHCYEAWVRTPRRFEFFGSNFKKAFLGFFGGEDAKL